MEVQYSEQYGYILPEVTITAEAQKKTPEVSSAGTIQNPYLEKIPVPEFDREKAEETIITKYGDENGIIDTDKMIEDFVDAGGEVITYVKNEKGELEKTNTHFTGGGARRTAIDSTGNVLGSDNLYSRLKQRGGIYDLSYNNEYYQEEPR